MEDISVKSARRGYRLTQSKKAEARKAAVQATPKKVEPQRGRPGHSAKTPPKGFGLPAKVEKPQTVRVIMRSGVVHASGQHQGKERQIAFRSVSYI